MPIAISTAAEKKKEITKISFENGNQRVQATAIPIQVAIPPMVGIGVICSFRTSGTSNSLNLCINLIKGGITMRAATKDVMNARMPNL